ncbi:hypothetical protein [Maribellus sediminis]|uniref:hypothetical protein n=1 Tax=Maribellus sediminis TaxID=2696285 RepID=UPI001430698E|nr:hypothetical protein [Maribellus sediminis]
MKQHNIRFKIVSSRVLAVIIILFTLAACGTANKDNVQNETAVLESTPSLLQEMNDPTSIENQNTETAIANLDVEEPQKATTTTTTTTTTDEQVKLNPPHGEPGHRCDIAVGAPLNSPSANATQPEKSASITPVIPAANTANTTIKPSTGQVGPTIENLKTFTPSKPINSSGQALVKNPPHGQPGHRCDIPVGDPLPATASNNPKLNPPHGQPGHRCDIPVGSPLPS